MKLKRKVDFEWGKVVAFPRSWQRLGSSEREAPRGKPVASGGFWLRLGSSEREAPRGKPVASGGFWQRFGSSEREAPRDKPVASLLILLIFVSLPVVSCNSFSSAPADPIADNLRLTSARGPLPDEAYKATLSVAYEAPHKIPAGQRTTFHLLVNNISESVWPYHGQPDGRYQVRAANRWLHQNGNTIEDARGELPYDLLPGGNAEVLLVITAPSMRGNYTLEFDLVQEQVAWFSQKGSEKLRMGVLVE